MFLFILDKHLCFYVVKLFDKSITSIKLFKRQESLPEMLGKSLMWVRFYRLARNKEWQNRPRLEQLPAAAEPPLRQKTCVVREARAQVDIGRRYRLRLFTSIS